MSKKRDAGLLLRDILICIDKIKKYTASLSYEQFLDSEMTLDAVFRNLEVIGEVGSRLNNEFRAKYSEIPWILLKNMRNKLIHYYTGIDYEIIWDICESHLEKLGFQVRNVLAEIDSENSNKK